MKDRDLKKKKRWYMGKYEHQRNDRDFPACLLTGPQSVAYSACQWLCFEIIPPSSLPSKQAQCFKPAISSPGIIHQVTAFAILYKILNLCNHLISSLDTKMVESRMFGFKNSYSEKNIVWPVDILLKEPCKQNLETCLIDDWQEDCKNLFNRERQFLL